MSVPTCTEVAQALAAFTAEPHHLAPKTAPAVTPSAVTAGRSIARLVSDRPSGDEPVILVTSWARGSQRAFRTFSSCLGLAPAKSFQTRDARQERSRPRRSTRALKWSAA